MMEHSPKWPALLCILNFQGHFKQVNAAWQQVLGISVQHLLTTTFTHWLHPDDFAMTQQALSQLHHAEAERVTFENRWRDPLGNYHWLLWMATVSLPEQLIYVAGLEATESKHSEQRYRAIVEGLQEGILLYENGTISLCNHSAEKLLGCPADQLIGQTEWPVTTLHEGGRPLPPESHPVAISLRTKEARKGTVIGIRQEEGLIWLNTHACLLRLHDTTEYDALVLSLADISDRKFLEDELHDRVILFSSLFEMAVIGMAILDGDGRFLRVNQTYCQLYGYQPHELIGQLFTVLLPPPLRKEAFLYYTDFSSETLTHAWSMQHHEGHLVNHQMFESKMVLPDKRPVRVIYVVPPMKSPEDVNHSEIFPSQEWFSLLTKHLAVTLVCLDRSGHVLFAEGQHLPKLGLVSGSSIFAAHLNLEPIIVDLEQVLNGETLNKTIVHKGITFEVHYLPFVKEDECLGAFIIFKEIEQKTLPKLSSSELEMPLGMIYVEGRKIVRVNQPGAELLGYSQAELLKTPIERLLSSQPDFAHLTYHLTQQISPCHHLYSLRKKDGTSIHCKLTVKATHYPQRTLWLIEKVRDNLQGNREVSLQTALWATTNEAILVTDLHLRIQQANPASVPFTGYLTDELIGQSLLDLNAGWQDVQFYQHIINTIRQLGQWQGEVWHRQKNHALYVCDLKVHAYSDKTSGYVAVLSNKRTSKSVFLDPLTNLPTRRVFYYNLLKTHAAAQRYDKRFAILMIGVDEMSTMNLKYGCKAGDQLLQTIGQTLRTSVRDSDTVARYDGDIFGVNLDEISKPQDAGLVAKMILFKLTQPVIFNESKVQGAVSIGIVVYPEDGNNVDALLELAQLARQRAKQRGGGQCCFHNSQWEQM